LISLGWLLRALIMVEGAAQKRRQSRQGGFDPADSGLPGGKSRRRPGAHGLTPFGKIPAYSSGVVVKAVWQASC
jgi:hypothetical protein